jgi:hypothetical protein
MKKIIAYQTNDGEVFTDYRDAKRHAEKRYGDLLLKLASALRQIDKYSAAVEYIEANLSQFVTLTYLKNDLEVVRNTDD